MAEKEYIEREAAMHIVKCTCGDYATAFSMIRKLPAVDVVEVVRCKDCKHLWRGYPERGMLSCRQSPFVIRRVKPDDFCSYGERKELDNV